MKVLITLLMPLILLCSCIEVRDISKYWDKGQADDKLSGKWVYENDNSRVIEFTKKGNEFSYKDSTVIDFFKTLKKAADKENNLEKKLKDKGLKYEDIDFKARTFKYKEINVLLFNGGSSSNFTTYRKKGDSLYFYDIREMPLMKLIKSGVVEGKISSNYDDNLKMKPNLSMLAFLDSSSLDKLNDKFLDYLNENKDEDIWKVSKLNRTNREPSKSANTDFFSDKKVHEAIGKIPDIPKINITKPDRFLNDLMLSPLWNVKKDREGSFFAKARSIGPEWSSDGKNTFLFEFMANPNRQLPKDYRIYNKYLDGDEIFSSFRATVIFRKPDLTRTIVGDSGETVTIPIYENFQNKIGLNSSSNLAIKLSKKHEIYIIFREQGSDLKRQTTFAKILPTMRELASLANSPEKYQAVKRYSKFFKQFFSLPLQDQEIKRLPGIQGRDTFYGYFKVKPETSYGGINIKISHPVYCPDEGTRKYSRLNKAEYLGKPYQEDDTLFFLIEDNAVYLSGDYDQRFGIFSGKESFEGDLEVLNDKNEVLLKTKGQFKGWQR